MARGDSTFQLPIILFLLLLTCQLLEAQRSNSSAGNLTVGCAEMEREALLKFKEDLIDLSGWLSSWVGDDCCNWVGVACHNQTGNVLSIDLKSPDVCEAFQDNEAAPYNKSCLSGTLNPSLLNLTYLNYLDLSHNGFYETPIPEFIGSLKNLRYLDLSLASFTGMVPPSLGNLSNLQYLDLSNGFSSGKLWVTDLNWLSGLSSLQYLHLTGTNLSMSTTDWLPAINMLPSLLELELGDCGLNNIHYSLPFINFTSLSTLDLSGNNFNSPIPQWLFNISSLSDVVISLSELSGSIPIVPRGNMCNLRTLDLSHNDINGDIEEFIEALSGCNNSTLRWFDSSSNKLGGRLPDSIGSFEYLYWLDLSNNSFLGPLPTSIGNLSRLGKLDLSFNKMSGAIPENIGQLSVVHQLNLHGNSWEGVITENHLQNLTRLRDFSLSSKGNALVFNVEANWIAPFSLLSLALSGCQLPAFPSWLITQVRLSELTISSASISDNIPDWFWRLLPNIWWLDLSHNKLKGELPHTISVSHEAWINLGFNRLEGSLPLWPNVTYLYLRNNFLTGPIPSNIGHEMSSLRNLDLSRNLLNGSIPLSMTEMRNLSSLDFSNNYLSGEIPSNWHGLERLMFLDLSNNTLSGGIPSSTCSQPSLMGLKLNSNNLSGDLSTTLQNCAPLALLDLGENKFFGSIPVAENMLYLSYLRLRANMLTGNIPEEICQFPNLHILDLAHNNLSGSIPKCLGSLTAFKHKAILFELPPSATQIPSSLHVELVLKGREDEYTTIFPLVNLIDLSSNNLTGEIPKEITNLSFMGTLNLSWNQLTGKIPENIGSLQQLETLDFSCNHLSGPIPPSMTSISFLNHLNLSYNNLTGQIPSTGQLQSLLEPSMYEGNPYLCGPPLTTNCSSGQGHVEDKDTEIPHEDESENFWFFISMGLGFIVGFWAVCGSLMVKKSWRYAYFRFVDEMKDKLLLIIAIHVARLRKKLFLNDKENVQRGPE